MRHVADRFVVFLDANVLYPFRMRDALFRFAEAGLFRARWSQDVIEEWRGALIRNKPQLRESVERQVLAMNAAFPEACVTGYDSLIQALHLPDADDRHVLAAAIVADAEHIVTENLKDFPPQALDPFGISAVTADDFLESTFEAHTPDAVAALRTMRRAYSAPPMTPREFIFDLQTRGLPKTASRLKLHMDVL